MKVLVLGHKGNMGRRYGAILDWLGVKWVGYDIVEDKNRLGPMNHNDEWGSDDIELVDIDKIIIATPTNSHFMDINNFIEWRKPILCEKPISKLIHHIIKLKKLSLVSMVNNWAFLSDAPRPWNIWYDYYNTGRDGLYWDCIQPIYLSNGNCKLRTKSPVFSLTVNGVRYTQYDFDHTYVEMVRAFVDGRYEKLWTMEDALEATEYVIKSIEKSKKEGK